MANKPVAVLISDIHFSLQTLALAKKAMEVAFAKANELDVPLCVLGDLHDTKANMRGECVNAMIEVFNKPHKKQPRVLVGNHDLINEKGKEHTLGFLRPYARVIDEVWHDEETAATFIPYRSQNTACVADFLRQQSGLLFCHQGLDTGAGFNDPSALQFEDVRGHRCISGHYHSRAVYRTGPGIDSTYTFLGNPYTLGFAEAADPEKGFHVLYANGLLDFVPLGLPRHTVVVATAPEHSLDINIHSSSGPISALRPIDPTLVKIMGPKNRLDKITRTQVQKALNLPISTFRLDLIHTDEVQEVSTASATTAEELLDKVIDSMQNTSSVQQLRLKTLWRNLAQK